MNRWVPLSLHPPYIGINQDKLDDMALSDTVFQILEKMGKISKKELNLFIKTHNIPIPDDLRDDELDRILSKTGEMYERVLDELIELESRVWRDKKDENES